MTDGPGDAVPDAQRIAIFPLNTVLFPGGALPLRIFEQRYLEMTKVCISENRPFGVCLIKEGTEVGTPAVPEEIGCLARIAQWEMPQLGVFQLMTEGMQRFRILDTSVGKYGLISAAVAILPNEPASVPQDTLCREVLKAIIEKVGADHFPAPLRLDDAAWVSYRLSEVLPIGLAIKQQLLQLVDAATRLSQLNRILTQQGFNRERISG